MHIRQRASTTAAAPAATMATGDSAVPRLDTSAVFGSAREVIILHRGQEYRLRITRAGKLILTK